jgi:hypothetical protein
VLHRFAAVTNDVGPISVPQSPAERWFYLITAVLMTLAGLAANVAISRGTRRGVTEVKETLDAAPTANGFVKDLHTTLTLMDAKLNTVISDVAEMRQENAADRVQLHTHIGDHARANVLRIRQKPH